MKIGLIITLTLTSSCLMLFNCTPQKSVQQTPSYNEIPDPRVNRDNYYDYYKTPEPNVPSITTDWLKREDVNQTIVDELQKLGLKVSSFIQYELPDSTVIILDVYNYKNDLGVVYNSGHIGSVEKKQRNIREFHQHSYKYSGTFGKNKLYKNLPNNILVLQETWYWYQYSTDGSNKGFLNKKTAQEILRQDVRSFIQKFNSQKK